jgi:hypothetical protein
MRYVGLFLIACCMFSCLLTQPDRNELSDTPAKQSTSGTPPNSKAGWDMMEPGRGANSFAQ